MTYYHVKDIRYLETDRTIDYFKRKRIHKKKLKKAMVRRDKTQVTHLKKNKPLLDVKHIVKERYLEFDDAIKDLSDPLNILSLISKFPGHRLFKIDPLKIEIS